jgi:DUF917 family protein
MAAFFTEDDIDLLAAGSAFLGTGGGGDPYVGALLCRTAIRRFGPVEIISVSALPDTAEVLCVAAFGAPTVLIEKLISVEDVDVAARRLERLLGFEADVIIAAEIGGINSTLPVAYAARRRLPVLDADGIGRAFPNLQMTTFNINGVAATPLALSNEHGDVVIIETTDARKAEDLARPLVAAMGASAVLAGYRMSGAEARGAVVDGSLSAALAIGRAIHDARSPVAPVERLLTALAAIPLYRHAYNLFDGKIVDVERRTTGGFVFGHCTVSSLSGGDQVTIDFQNENLMVKRGKNILAIVPDLITVVDTESAQAIPTESLRYGQRVSVIGCSAPDALRTPAALKIVSPAQFQLSEPFTPIEIINGGKLSDQPDRQIPKGGPQCTIN